jgi:uncharacterized RDD family membrane protein YckC
MSNDPYGERPSDPAPGGWGDDPGRDAEYGTGPDAGYGPAPGWGQDPIPSGGRPASVGKRFGAFILDAMGLGIVLGIVLVLTPLGGNIFAADGGGYVQGLIFAIATVAYFALMEAASGQTVAKRLLGIKVVSEDGSPVSIQQAVIRRVPFVVGNVLPTFIGGLVSFGLTLAILITAIQDQVAHQGLHDKWGKTRVIEV